MFNSNPKAKIGFRILSVLFSVLLFAIVAMSFVFNMGWLHFILVFALVPVWHFAILFYVNQKMLKYFGDSRKILKDNIILNLTYLLLYAFIPDFSDIGDPYVLFGQIQFEYATCFLFLAVGFLAFHVIMLSNQIGIIKAEKRKIKQ